LTAVDDFGAKIQFEKFRSGAGESSTDLAVYLIIGNA
jgi:hypothetical protein